jgi:hypothetical protein
VKTFKSYFQEMNMAGPGGVFGGFESTGGAVGNIDSYAKGDSRVPKVLGMYTRSGKLRARKKKKDRK